LTESAWSCGKSMADMVLPGDLKIVEIHREQEVFAEDSLKDLVFHRGDVIILNGHLDQISLGESYLLLGR